MGENKDCSSNYKNVDEHYCTDCKHEEVGPDKWPCNSCAHYLRPRCFFEKKRDTIADSKKIVKYKRDFTCAVCDEGTVIALVFKDGSSFAYCKDCNGNFEFYSNDPSATKDYSRDYNSGSWKRVE